MPYPHVTAAVLKFGKVPCDYICCSVLPTKTWRSTVDFDDFVLGSFGLFFSGIIIFCLCRIVYRFDCKKSAAGTFHCFQSLEMLHPQRHSSVRFVDCRSRCLSPMDGRSMHQGFLEAGVRPTRL